MQCKDCTKRHLNCHATCETYKQWKQELAERKEKINKAKAEDDHWVEYYADLEKRYKRRKK